MIRGWGKQAIVVLIGLSLILMPLTAVGTGTATAANGSTTYELTDSIDIWQRAPLPLRLSNDDAAKTIQNGALTVEYTPQSTGPLAAREAKTGVYHTGDTITTTFESVSGASTDAYNGSNTQLVIARLSPDATTNDLPTNVDDARSLLTTDNANNNATFRVKNTGTIGATTDDELSTDVTFSQSGMYAVFLATVDSGSGFSADQAGNLSVSGQVTIVGMDHALVESTSASTTVNTNSIHPGNDISVTVNDLPTTATNVTVLVYKRDTWIGSETNLRVDDQIDRDFAADNVTIEHSISDVNGIATFDGPLTVMGTTFGDNQVSGTTPLATIIDTLVSNADDRTNKDITGPKTSASDSTVIDASAVGKADVTGGSASFTIETYSNWSTGTYQYVVLAGGSDAGEIRTDVGTLTISKKKSGGYTPPYSPPPSNPPEENETDNGSTPPSTPTNPGSVKGAGKGATVKKTGGKVSVTLPNASKNERVTISLNTTETNETGVGVDELDIGFTENTSGGLSINSESNENVTEKPVSRDGDLGYIRITHNFSDTSVADVTFTFQVSKQKLEARGLNPDDVSLYRLEPDGWNELETTRIGETTTTYRYRAISPGLSLYSISQKNAAKPAFDVTDASVSPTEITAGESVDVTATIENTGGSSGTFTANLTIDGTVVTMQRVQIPAGEQRTVTFTHQFEDAGTYDVGVSGTAADTVTVTEQQTTTPETSTTATQTTTSTSTTPGATSQGGIEFVAFGVLILVIAVVGAFFLYRRNN